MTSISQGPFYSLKSQKTLPKGRNSTRASHMCTHMETYDSCLYSSDLLRRSLSLRIEWTCLYICPLVCQHLYSIFLGTLDLRHLEMGRMEQGGHALKVTFFLSVFLKELRTLNNFSSALYAAFSMRGKGHFLLVIC